MLSLGTGTLSIRPFGLTLTGTVQRKEDEPVGKFRLLGSQQVEFTGKISGKTPRGHVEREITFALPDIDRRGVFHVFSTPYVLVRRGFPDPRSVQGGWVFLDHGAMLRRLLHQALCRGVAQLFFQGELNQVALETSILGALTENRYVRAMVKGREDAFVDSVVLDRPGRLSARDYRFPEELLGGLDPCSTSSDDKAGEIFQLADGARIENARLVPGEQTFCRFTRSFTIRPDLVPKRAYLLRATGLNAMDLLRPDPDLYGRRSQVHSQVLTTAILDLGVHTYEDLVAVRPDLAFSATDTSFLHVWSDKPLTMMVEEGDFLQTNTVLAQGEGFLHCTNAPSKDNKVRMGPVSHPTVLEAVFAGYGYHLGRRMVRTLLTLRRFMDLEEGDKLSNLSGCKGVARKLRTPIFLPDGTPVDIVVSASSVARRGVAGQMHLEMMVREYARRHGRPPEDLSYRAHFLLGHSPPKQKLVIEGREVWAQVGQVAWVRHNKLARQIASAVGEERLLTPEGLPVESASLAGQSFHPSIGLCLQGRGMPRLLEHALSYTTGRQMVRDVIEAIEAPARQFSPQG